MEGGLHVEADSSAFRDCFSLAWKNPYVLRLAFSAGIGGLLFGYDTGVISGALLYIRDDFQVCGQRDCLTVPGAIIGAAIGDGRTIGMEEENGINESSLVHLGRSPAKIRGALVSTNGLLITGGQFLSYLINLGSTKASSRDLAVDAWSCRNYSSSAVHPNAAPSRISTLAILKGVSKISIVELLRTKTVQRGLIAGVGLQVFQQFVGINTVMYYNPTIVLLAGFASNQTALLLSLVTASLNAFGSIVSIYFIDRTGRKKLLIISLLGVIIALGLLLAVFHETTSHSPLISLIETSHFTNYTCLDYSSAGNSAAWDCMKCLKSSSPDCGFCASKVDKLLPRACLISNDTTKDSCHGEDRLWYTRGCPSKYGLACTNWPGPLHHIFFSGNGHCAMDCQLRDLSFKAIGTSWTFLIFGIISFPALIFVLIFVPETEGLPIEEFEKMLELRALHFKFWEKGPRL
ncbi:putative major facilitator, sugar transporter, major facilitator superfamily [Rosa chinensis]|uniref:Putative major facilitator, sugar transporter, major facilitator superfamily n=1 Tax=Rosa chinensis TaxID=74649 RepID=A0A2P6Q5N5_ROSCH|nr:putative major facilitator, sugar transporter, major facilitator superfamily [Rosa chinensis]